MPDQTTPPPEVYNAAYYEGGCGPHPYRRDERWMAFFGDAADRIVAEIRPRSVMDVGCAIGLLVECLRERGVDARGIDVSDYAISQLPTELADYCSIGSALEPLPGRYDLITCIEIVEHLSAEDGERAMDVLCSHTDDILFSSSPLDEVEPTHVNVQSTDYWAAAFARRGFFRDAGHDASYISPWAVRFRRLGEGSSISESMEPVIAAYERRLWAVSREADDARTTASERSSEVEALQERVAGLDSERRALDESNASLRADVDQLVSRWGVLDRAFDRFLNGARWITGRSR